MKKLTICYTTYNRVDLLVASFMDIHSHELVDSIVIVDDHSDLEYYEKLADICSHFSKVRLYRNERNLDCYANKHQSILMAETDYVISFDSDNAMTADYLDKIASEEWHEDLILMPSFAEPTFNFTEFSNLVISKANVAAYMNRPMFSTMLNCFNMFINRKKYLEVWDGTVDPVTADSIYFNLCWFQAGYRMKVVDGLRYHHLIHSGSHYRNNVARTPSGFYEQVEKKLLALK